MAARTLYEILYLKPDASGDEVHKAYKRLAREHHPDRFVDPTAKRKAEQVFAEMTEAFNVLSSTEKRKEYDHKLREAGQGENPTQKEAKNYFRAGTVKLGEGNAKDAVRLFQAAIHLDSTQGSYYAHYAKALEADGAFGEASRQWDEAIKREPFNPKYYRLAGQCLERAGMKLRARKMYEAAIKWDKGDTASSEALERLADQPKKGLLGSLFRKS